MANIKFNDLMAEAAKDEKTVVIEGPDGTPVKLREFSNLPGADFKLVLKYMDILQDKKVKESEKIDAMDLCLIAACDKKDVMREMLDLLPLSGREVIFDAWMEAAEVPES
ncbi:hypothetical protein ACFC1L_40080 [Streptomyces sp. NPDC056210]|uniref:hypothetical protein n=1 Tax=Streptomyces sp. NPDC056210 TaxID=3345746 RepID=UPI0035DE852E